MRKIRRGCQHGNQRKWHRPYDMMPPLHAFRSTCASSPSLQKTYDQLLIHPISVIVDINDIYNSENDNQYQLNCYNITI
ncbi:hypothetical protein VIBNIAM115_980011 [Vibrio nigripulchritudo AM115]|nr:hypothetical protein VIBNIAM115_980011 [Vibrio nigripulchritudo AM115]